MVVDDLGRLANRVSVCVEGNISAGKTTFLKNIIGRATRLLPPGLSAGPGSTVYRPLLLLQRRCAADHHAGPRAAQRSKQSR